MVLPAIAIAFAVSFGLSILLTFVVRAAGRRRALLDSAGAPGHTKVLRSVPNIGGIAIFWSFALPIIIALAAIWSVPTFITAIAPAAEPHLPGIRSQTGLALGLLGCTLVLHIMGLIDDRRALGPWLKFAVQFAVAAAIVLLFDVRILTLLDGFAGGPWLSAAITVLWIVTITNAMNFMDNMDGLSAGVAATAAAGLLLSALASGQWFVAATLAILIGALGGFLVFNFPFSERRGATIFMGDGGSLVIGFLLAFLAVRVTYVTAPIGGAARDQAWLTAPGSLAMLMPLCALAIPLYDLVSVSIIRLSQGRSPLVGDRQHFSHRLRAAGLSVRRTVLVICGCTAITGITGILLAWATVWQAALAVLQVFLVLALIAIYEHGRGWKDPAAGSGA
jgi:UDP-GlcNAc:undecaprenyl-phosphate GlcNAc-1-phosphate transferase